MHTPTLPARSFTAIMGTRTNRLIYPAVISHGDKQIQVNVLWDTGATTSAISPEVVDKLQLAASGWAHIDASISDATRVTYKINITLSSAVTITEINAQL